MQSLIASSSEKGSDPRQGIEAPSPTPFKVAPVGLREKGSDPRKGIETPSHSFQGLTALARGYPRVVKMLILARGLKIERRRLL